MTASDHRRQHERSPIHAHEQLVFARFLASGGMARHLRRVRPIYRRRRDALLAALAVSFPDATPMGVSVVGHLHVQLPDHCDEDAMVGAAYRRGVVAALGSLAHVR